MTQGEILSALAPIDTFIEICKESLCRNSAIGINEVNTILPFAKSALSAAEKVSHFALEHFNSRDEHKRELSKLICGSFEMLLVELELKKFKGRSPYDTTVDYLNYHVTNLRTLVFNTVVACEQLLDTLPPSTNRETKDEKEKNSADDNGNKESELNVTGNPSYSEGFEEGGNEGQEVDGQVNKEMYEEEQQFDEDEDTEEIDEELNNNKFKPQEWDDTFDHIFDEKVRPQEIKRAMDTVKSEKIKDRRFHYVAYRILKVLKWIPVEISESDYLKWINCHFECGWENNKNQKKAFLFNLEGTVKRLDDLHPSEWKDDTLYSNLGKYYRLLAISFKNAFTYTMIDKKPVEDSESYEHLKDRVEFLSEARDYHGALWAPDEAYINDGN